MQGDLRRGICPGHLRICIKKILCVVEAFRGEIILCGRRGWRHPALHCFLVPENRRLLPWRENPEPYSVWISEIMLQQTWVEAVKTVLCPFYGSTPGHHSLAQVDEERLLKLWEGLGYYSRARNLKRQRSAPMEDYGGRMPASRMRY